MITILQLASALILLTLLVLLSGGFGENAIAYLRTLQPLNFNLFDEILWYSSVFQASGLLPGILAGEALFAFLFLLAAIRLVIIAGFWFLKRWGWVLLMVQLGFVMLIDLYAYFSGSPHYFSMLNSVLVIFYLNQRDVQQAFQARQRVVEAV